MVIITADMQHTPTYAIQRDVSMFQVASKDSTQEQNEKAIRDYIIRECQRMYTYAVSQYSPRSSAAQQAAQEVRQDITIYLISLNHPIADQILKEYRAQWKNQ